MIKSAIPTLQLSTGILPIDMWRYLFFIIGLCSCSTSKEDVPNHQSPFEASVFHSEYSGFGYDIRRGDKLIIHQSTVPTSAGNQGFATRQSAQKMAALVITKLEEGLMPPTVTADEVNTVLKNDVP